MEVILLLNLLLCIAHQSNIIAAPILKLNPNQDSPEDSELTRWSAIRKSEFHNLTETSYQRNEQLLNELRHRNADWTMARSCRISSHNLTQEQCYSPVKRPQSCFGVMLQQNYTLQNGTFGAFPKLLGFLRHFPRCWMRISPIICLGQYRPCTLSTTNNADGSLYVMLEQFSANACLNMLDHCAFVSHHLIDIGLPSYLNCESHYANANQRMAATEKTLYRQDCKVNHNNEHPELAALGKDSFQCLWPLVKSSKSTEDEASVAIHASPIIDGCYLPCQSPLFRSGAIRNFHRFGTVWYFIMLLIILVAVGALILNFKITKRHKFPIILYSVFAGTFLLAFIGLLLLMISIFPFAEHRVLGEFATCLPIGGTEEQIRRHPADFNVPEGKENLPCAFQAFLLGFCLLTIDWSSIVIFSKILLLPLFPRMHLLFPSWNSILLPLAIFIPPLMFTFVDLFTNMISIEPVSGICHFFLHGHSLSMVHYFMYPLIAVITVGLICHLNSLPIFRKVPNNRRNQRHAMNNHLTNVNNPMNYNVECQRILQTNELSSETPNIGNGELKRHEEDLEGQRTTSNTDEKLLESKSAAEIGARETSDESAPLQNFENASGNMRKKCWRKILSNCFLTSLQAVNSRAKKLFIFWIILLISRTIVGYMLSGPEEETRFILESINCSINRTFTERIPLDFVDRIEYRRNPETNPYIRKRILGEHVSAPYCELKPHNLGWYWLFTILLGSEFSVVAVLILSLIYFTDYLKVEQELEEKEAQRLAAVELLEINDKRGNEPSVNDDDDEQHSGSNAVYDRISTSSVNSTLLPASTLLPPSTMPPQPPQTAIPNPQSPPNPAAAQNDNLVDNNENNGSQYGDGPASDLASVYLSHYSLPPMFMQLPQCAPPNHGYGFFPSAAVMAAAATISNGLSTTPIDNNTVNQWILRNCGLNGGDADPKLGNFGKWRKRAGSDPGQTSTQPVEEVEQRTEADKRKGGRRRHKLYIRNPPKELEKEWLREEREGKTTPNSKEYKKKYTARRTSSIGGESTNLDLLYRKLNPNLLPNSALSNAPTSTPYTSNPHYYFHPQYPFCYYPFPFAQQPSTLQDQLLALQQHNPCCSLSLFPNQQVAGGTAQQNSFEFNEYTDDKEIEEGSGVQEEEDGEEEDEEEEEQRASTTSPEPSSSIPSSTTDSNDFHSDSPDSFEEKRWEEMMRKEKPPETS